MSGAHGRRAAEARRAAPGKASGTPSSTAVESERPKESRTPDGSGAPGGSKAPRTRVDLGTEITASLVVFLVALPLCIGVAVASGVPAELGIISGVIGGLVVGAVRGSTLQVSGPAAGLAALVAETVLEFGVAMLGVIVLFSGILQIVLGLVKLGRMFQAISLAVVQGMLAGIGLPLMFSQLYPMSDAKAPGTPLENMAGVPGLIADTATDPQALVAAGLGVVTIVLSFLWKKAPGPVRKVPAALVAVGIGIGVASLPGVDVKTLQVGNLLASVDVPGPEQLAGLADAGIITAILTFTVIASAESLFTAAAVDRMHNGPRTRYNTELIAQGAGNTIAGVLGALPVTAVVARSSANVQAGAKTRISRTLHGLWLLAFALLLPQVLALIPISVLAGVLVHSGWKLFAPEEFPKMWRQDRGECAVMTVTTLVITATALLEGVLIGLAAGVVLAALRMSQTVVRQHIEDDTAKVVMAGNATFLRLPRLIDALENAAASGKPRIRLDLLGITHLDHACRAQVEEFVAQQRGAGVRVELLMPDLGKVGAGAGGVAAGVDEVPGPLGSSADRLTADAFVPGYMAPDHLAVDHSGPGYVAPDHLAQGHTAADLSAPGYSASDHMTPVWDHSTMPRDFLASASDPGSSVGVGVDEAHAWDFAGVGAVGAGSSGDQRASGPGPTAEWFYLDTRPMPGADEGGALLLRKGRDWAE